MPQTSPNWGDFPRLNCVSMVSSCCLIANVLVHAATCLYLFVATRSTSYKVFWTDRTPFHDSILEKASLLHWSLGKNETAFTLYLSLGLACNCSFATSITIPDNCSRIVTDSIPEWNPKKDQKGVFSGEVFFLLREKGLERYCYNRSYQNCEATAACLPRLQRSCHHVSNSLSHHRESCAV
jgi:hypothetical protein